MSPFPAARKFRLAARCHAPFSQRGAHTNEPRNCGSSRVLSVLGPDSPPSAQKNAGAWSRGGGEPCPSSRDLFHRRSGAHAGARRAAILKRATACHRGREPEGGCAFSFQRELDIHTYHTLLIKLHQFPLGPEPQPPHLGTSPWHWASLLPSPEGPLHRRLPRTAPPATRTSFLAAL